jgi:hypothetical protein
MRLKHCNDFEKDQRGEDGGSGTTAMLSAKPSALSLYFYLAINLYLNLPEEMPFSLTCQLDKSTRGRAGVKHSLAPVE